MSAVTECEANNSGLLALHEAVTSSAPTQEPINAVAASQELSPNPDRTDGSSSKAMSTTGDEESVSQPSPVTSTSDITQNEPSIQRPEPSQVRSNPSASPKTSPRTGSAPIRTKLGALAFTSPNAQRASASATASTFQMYKDQTPARPSAVGSRTPEPRLPVPAEQSQQSEYHQHHDRTPTASYTTLHPSHASPPSQTHRPRISSAMTSEPTPRAMGTHITAKMIEEVSGTFEKLAEEFAKVDDAVLVLQDQNPGRKLDEHVRSELMRRRNQASDICDQLHEYCANNGMTIWCPSTAAIQRMNAHVEEDIQLAQEELSALAAKGRDCQHLLKYRCVLLIQRYFWAVRLNRVRYPAI